MPRPSPCSRWRRHNYPIPPEVIAGLYGAGARTDHIDLIGTDGVYAAGGIDYTIP